MKKSIAIMIILIAILIVPVKVSAQGDIYLRHIDGHDGMGLISNTWITFHIGLSNWSGSNITGLQHGFHFYSPNGATWTPPSGEWAPALQPVCDLGFWVNPFGDTIGFSCSTLLGPGVPDGFDGDAMLIRIWIDMDHLGKTVCFDSSFFPPAGIWMWSTTSGGWAPTWDGPHCFEVTNFTWLCGDIDNNGTVADIADLTYFIEYLFHGGPPPEFPFSPDVNGTGVVDITDLTSLVDFMFNGGPPLHCF